MPQGGSGGSSREAQRPPLSGQLTTTVPPLQQENARGRTLTYDDLARFFHLPINAAAKELGVCVTALKKQCRKHGVPRWPHRKLKSLDKLKEKLEKEEATAADKEYYKHELHSITQKKDHIFRSSSGNGSSSAALATSPRLPHRAGPLPASGLHPRPAQLVMGRPISHFHPGTPVPQKTASPQLSAHYANVQTRNPALVATTPNAMDSEQQQQHIIAAPLMMPFAHMSGSGPTAVAAPNGNLMAQPPPGAQQFSMCGIFGCDCYLNNGVSTRMYHPPIAAVRHPGNGTHPGPNAAIPPGVHYFNPAAYAYAPAMAQIQPYQNMLQVNVLEHPTYPHGARPPQQQASTPANSTVVNSSACQSQPMMHHPAKGSSVTAPSGVEVYGGLASNGNAGSFVYNTFMPPNVHCEGMMGHQGNATSAPGYWSDMQHQQAPSNMVTMCNQTVHHHHHHGGETAVTSSPVLTSGNSGRRQGGDNTSSKTNNSNKHVQAISTFVNEKCAKEALNSVDMENDKLGNADRPGQREPMEMVTSSKRADGSPARPKNAVETRSVPSAFGSKSDAKNSKPHSSTQDGMPNKSSSSQTQSESKCVDGGLDSVPNGVHASSMQEIANDENESETSSYAGCKNREKPANEYPRQTKRARTQLTPVRNAASAANCVPEQGRPGSCSHVREPKGAVSEQQTSTANKRADASSAARNKHEKTRDRKRSSITTGATNYGLPNGRAPSGAMLSNTASLFDRARRYDHVVQQCVGLQSAQWCTDLNFKVTLALGPKSMLALAGVPSLGKSVLDCTGTALDDRNTIKNKYLVVGKGQRLEWITGNGNSRYLIVMSPFRKRKQTEICGVSGIMIELKIIQALAQ